MYTTYMGVIDYYATGEGRSIWIYVKNSQSLENFKEEMKLACDIHEYYIHGIQINPEHWMEKYKNEFDIVKDAGAAEFKYYLYFNFA